MENLNLAELLKDCPKGMKLYSPIFGDVYLDKIRPHLAIVITTDKKQGDFKEEFLYDGRYGMNGECMLFPSKGKTTWEGFQRPFKDGDIVTWEDRGSLVAFIYKERKDVAVVKHHFALYTGSLGTVTDGEISLVENEIVFATEEEKQKLFDAIKANGYQWNIETKTLEKLIEPRFKNGDIIFTHANCLNVGLGNTWISIYKENRNGGVATYIDYAEDGSDFYSDLDGDKAFLCMERDILRQRIATEEEKQKLFDAIKANGYKWNAETKTLEKLVEPKFKVGDKIKDKNNKIWFVVQVSDKHFSISLIPNAEGYFVPIEDQDEYELAPDKFDITTLVPFESRVLVRECKKDVWQPTFYGFFHQPNKRFYTTSNTWLMCIPYNKDTKHLVGTTNDCDDFYKTWENNN